MPKKHLVTILASLGILIVAGCASENQNGQTNVVNSTLQNPYIAAVSPTLSMPAGRTSNTPAPTDTIINKANTAPLYLEYTLARFNLLKNKQPIVLFFQGNKCQSCVTFDGMIRRQLPIFPRNTQILKVDYDKEKALANTYKVASKNTVVILDKAGKVSLKSVNPTIIQLLTTLKKIM